MNLEQRIDSWVVDPQAQSPLFAKVPAEIRTVIFTLALNAEMSYHRIMYEPKNPLAFPRLKPLPFDHDGSPDQDIADELASAVEDPDLVKSYSIQRGSNVFHGLLPNGMGGEWSRPFLTTTLLGTCRRVYTEARLLIYSTERYFNDTMIYRVNRPPRRRPGPELPNVESYGFYVPSPQGYWSTERAAWERCFPNIRFVGNLMHWSSFVLNDTWPPFARFAKKRHQLSTVQHLRFSPSSSLAWSHLIRSGCNPDVYNSWSPFLLRSEHSIGLEWILMDLYMQALARLEETNEPSRDRTVITGRPGWIPVSDKRCVYRIGSWAREFVNMPHIQSFTMDFHLSEDVRDKFDQVILPYIIDTWAFPLNPDHAGYHYMSAQGNEVQKFSWRGSFEHWSSDCLECTRGITSGEDVGGPLRCKTHDAIREKIAKAVGPRMYTWTVTWTRRKHDDSRFRYPYNGAIELCDRDWQQDGDSDLEEGEEIDWEEHGFEPEVEGQETEIKLLSDKS